MASLRTLSSRTASSPKSAEGKLFDLGRRRSGFFARGGLGGRGKVGPTGAMKWALLSLPPRTENRSLLCDPLEEVGVMVEAVPFTMCSDDWGGRWAELVPSVSSAGDTLAAAAGCNRGGLGAGLSGLVWLALCCCGLSLEPFRLVRGLRLAWVPLLGIGTVFD